MILGRVLASRTRARASNATSGSDVACETQRGRLDLAPHGALGGFAQATRCLSRARRPAPAASAGWATAAAATEGGGVRPCASRRTSHSLSESDATSGAPKMATGAVRQGTPGPSPWGARVASRQGRPRQMRRRVRTARGADRNQGARGSTGANTREAQT